MPPKYSEIISGASNQKHVITNQVGLDDQVPFLLESKLKEYGANYSKADKPWEVRLKKARDIRTIVRLCPHQLSGFVTSESCRKGRSTSDGEFLIPNVPIAPAGSCAIL